VGKRGTCPFFGFPLLGFGDLAMQRR
jgi:hypothetical protein